MTRDCCEEQLMRHESNRLKHMIAPIEIAVTQ
jgi:hypothetical protein